MQESYYTIRKAKIKDVKDIKKLLEIYVEKGIMLPRSLSELYENIRDFYICENRNGEIIGTSSLHICWEKLAEIRSLAVKEGFLRRGIGRKLAESCIEDADKLGVKNIFVLTYNPKFFEKIGFKIVDKSIFPHKVWNDCLKCFKFPNCDEIALMLEIK
jgi:amino-acid N-acetyltransferase